MIAESTTTADATRINPDTGTYGDYSLGIVNIPQGIVSGDGCYDDTGDIIVLISNKQAIDPSYSQLLKFLQGDTVDEYPYVNTGKAAGPLSGTPESHIDLIHIQNIIDGKAQPSAPDVCADFAERLHNDAEMAGIKCAFVTLHTSEGFHALNAFQTTDQGLIYVDDTGLVAGTYSLNAGTPRCVKTVNMTIDQNYVPVSLFPYPCWSSAWDSMGTIISYQVTWNGIWDNPVN